MLVLLSSPFAFDTFQLALYLPWDCLWNFPSKRPALSRAAEVVSLERSPKAGLQQDAIQSVEFAGDRLAMHIGLFFLW